MDDQAEMFDLTFQCQREPVTLNETVKRALRGALTITCPVCGQLAGHECMDYGGALRMEDFRRSFGGGEAHYRRHAGMRRAPHMARKLQARRKAQAEKLAAQSDGLFWVEDRE